MKSGKLAQRGPLNPNKVNKAYLDEVLKKKFSVMPHDLKTEEQLEQMVNKGITKTKALRDFVDSRIKEAVDPLDKQAWIMYSVLLKVEDLEGSVDKEFVMGFLKWLQGKGRDEDHQKTPWYRTPIKHPAVDAFLTAWAREKADYFKQLDTIKHMPYLGFQTINEFYLYYKYIVRGKFDDDSDYDWMPDLTRLIENSNPNVVTTYDPPADHEEKLAQVGAPLSHIATAAIAAEGEQKPKEETVPMVKTEGGQLVNVTIKSQPTEPSAPPQQAEIPAPVPQPEERTFRNEVQRLSTLHAELFDQSTLEALINNEAALQSVERAQAAMTNITPESPRIINEAAATVVREAPSTLPAVHAASIASGFEAPVPKSINQTQTNVQSMLETAQQTVAAVDPRFEQMMASENNVRALLEERERDLAIESAKRAEVETQLQKLLNSFQKLREKLNALGAEGNMARRNLQNQLGALLQNSRELVAAAPDLSHIIEGPGPEEVDGTFAMIGHLLASSAEHIRQLQHTATMAALPVSQDLPVVPPLPSAPSPAQLELENKVRALESDVTRLRGALENSAAGRLALEEENTRRALEYEGKVNETNQLALRLTELETQIQTARQQNAIANAQLEASAAQMNLEQGPTPQMIEWENEKTALVQQLRNAQAANEQLAIANAQNTQQFQLAQEQYRQLEHQAQESSRLLAEKQNHLAALENEYREQLRLGNEAREQKQLEFKADLEEVKNTYEMVRLQNRQLAAQRDESLGALEKVNAERALMSNAGKNLELQLQAANENTAVLVRQLEASKADNHKMLNLVHLQKLAITFRQSAAFLFDAPMAFHRPMLENANKNFQQLALLAESNENEQVQKGVEYVLAAVDNLRTDIEKHGKRQEAIAGALSRIKSNASLNEKLNVWVNTLATRINDGDVEGLQNLLQNNEEMTNAPSQLLTRIFTGVAAEFKRRYQGKVDETAIGELDQMVKEQTEQFRNSMGDLIRTAVKQLSRSPEDISFDLAEIKNVQLQRLKEGTGALLLSNLGKGFSGLVSGMHARGFDVQGPHVEEMVDQPLVESLIEDDEEMKRLAKKRKR
jgi:hypothetical protein